MNEDQEEVKQALIEEKPDSIVAGVTGDEKAVAIKVNDEVGAYFSPSEVRELNKAIVREVGEERVGDAMKKAISHFNTLADVVKGDITQEDAEDAMPPEVEVSYPGDDADE